jgi:hypothetical protein
MTFLSGRKAMPLLLCLMAVAPPAVRAQDGGLSPHLLIKREFLKPDRGGTIHEQTEEAAYLGAAKAGKPPFHYFSVTSMNGQDRVLFISGYPSFAALEAEGEIGQKNPILGAGW